MDQEVYREVWYLEGTEELFEKVENYLQELDMTYHLKAQLKDEQDFSIVIKERDE